MRDGPVREHGNAKRQEGSLFLQALLGETNERVQQRLEILVLMARQDFPSPRGYFFSSSLSSFNPAASATDSSASSRSRRTPCVERPASRISFACTRITLPLCVMIITSDSSVTCSVATTNPLRSVVFMLPPPDVMRYSASGVRLP